MLCIITGAAGTGWPVESRDECHTVTVRQTDGSSQLPAGWDLPGVSAHTDRTYTDTEQTDAAHGQEYDMFYQGLCSHFLIEHS